MTEPVERMLPCDLNAEAAVLSAMMIDNSSVARVVESIKENHFYKSAHKIVYRAIIDLLCKYSRYYYTDA